MSQDRPIKPYHHSLAPMVTHYEYDPDSIRVSFRGVEMGTHTFQVIEPKTTNPKLWYKATLELRAPAHGTGLRQMMGRLYRGSAPYLTPRKRRRIRRRHERSKLEFEAFEFYGIPPKPGEFTKALRQRCRDTWY